MGWTFTRVKEIDGVKGYIGSDVLSLIVPEGLILITQVVQETKFRLVKEMSQELLTREELVQKMVGY
jgi:hypothetical protein